MRIMEVEVNEHIVRISAGYVNCPTPLEIDQDVVLTVEGSVVKVEDKTNNDGTVDRVYTVKGAILYVNEEPIDS